MVLIYEAVLKDGEWHTLDEVVKAVWPKVHRPSAIRRAEASYATWYRRRFGTDPEPQPVTETTVYSGARSLIRDALNGWSKWLERDGNKIRLTGISPKLAPYLNLCDNPAPPNDDQG